MQKRIIIAGGTGLVGKQVVAELAGLDDVDTHMLMRPLSGKPILGITQHLASPDNWPAVMRKMKIDVAICCLGTTIKTAGAKAAFRAVDYDLVLEFAKAARGAGARQFIAVSSVGASAKSNNFYLKTKGEVEDAVRALGFERVDFLRPGLLTGGSRPDTRLGETIAKMLSPMTDLLLWGALGRYRSTPSAKVARAVVTLALGGGHGQFIHENESIHALAG